MKFKVQYMSGAGNLFTVIDGRNSPLLLHEWSNYVSTLCGVDGDQYRTEGLIIVRNDSDILDFEAEFFNPDGSHGAMCGNGARCAVQFAKQILGLNRVKNVSFTMAEALYIAEFQKELVRVYFPQPIVISPTITLEIDEVRIVGSYIDVGSQHFVVDYAQVSITSMPFELFDIEKFAPQYRHHASLAPSGANVNIYELQKNGTVRLRTYERGVEAETGACGTGAISTAISLIMAKKTTSPVKVIPTSGIGVTVGWNQSDRLWLEGPADFIGNAEIIIE